jgi:hypothetical protein
VIWDVFLADYVCDQRRAQLDLEAKQAALRAEDSKRREEALDAKLSGPNPNAEEDRCFCADLSLRTCFLTRSLFIQTPPPGSTGPRA